MSAVEVMRKAIAEEIDELRLREMNLVNSLEDVRSKLQAYEELDEQVKQLDGGESPKAAPPSAAAPAAPRRKPSTSAGRRSQPQRADKAHTARGASTGGRRAVQADDIVADVKRAFRELGRSTPNAVGLHLGYPKSTSGMVAVREVVSKLLAAGELKVDGNVRGRPAYSLAQARAIPLPPGPTTEGSHFIDQLVDKIVEQLEVDGGRVARKDLADRVGNPEFEDFQVALDRAVNLKKINRVSAGGTAGFELAK